MREIVEKTSVNRGSIHRVLRMFEGYGWVTHRSFFDDTRPARVVYRVTKAGADAISAALLPFQLSNRST